ncbi:hypothetical protein [Streptomyces sp. NPDC004976]
MVALIVMHLAAAWLGARTWCREHAVLAAAVARTCGGLVGGAVSVWALFPDLLRWDVFFSALVWLGFTSLMVLLRTGLPASPRTPSRETLTLANLGCRLRRTATTVAVAAVLGGCGPSTFSFMVDGHTPPRIWLYGIFIGTVLALGQSTLRWVSAADSRDDLSTQAKLVCGDRLVKVISCVIGSLLFLRSRTALDVVEHQESSAATTFLGSFDDHPWSVCAFGVVLAVIPYSWPRYTVTRCLMAAGGCTGSRGCSWPTVTGSESFARSVPSVNSVARI